MANGQSVTTAEDTAMAITLTGSDVEFSSLTYTVASSPAHGALMGSGSSRTYTPAANYNGADSFSFYVTDGQTNSAMATVSITVTAVNDAPVANPLSLTLTEGASTNFTLTASDVDSGTLTYTGLTAPTNGTLSGSAPNLTYRTAANLTDGDSLYFSVLDGSLSSRGLVSLSVLATKHSPVANSQSVSTEEDTASPITLTGSDLENAPLNFIVVSSPGHGSLSGSGANRTYTPAADFNGTDSFTFKANEAIWTARL